MFSKELLLPALKDSFTKLSIKTQIKNPVMFLVYIGSIVTTIYGITELFSSQDASFTLTLSIWLWFTVLFANFSEAIAEGRGKAQADSLRKTKSDVMARLVESNGERLILASELTIGNIVRCSQGDVIPSDGEIIEGIASIDESAITGESAPVIRESGGDRSAVTGGTRIISDSILVKITSKYGETFIDKLIALVEGAKRKKTPNELALSIVLSGLSIILFVAIISLIAFIDYSQHQSLKSNHTSTLSIPIMIAFLVCLIPTTIGGLMNAIGISGMDRLLQRNVIAKSGRAVESAGDVDILLLDKTGTITLGNRMASKFYPINGIDEIELATASHTASLPDETAEGRSIVILAKEQYNIVTKELLHSDVSFIPFSAQTKLSGIKINELGSETTIYKGAASAVKQLVEYNGYTYPIECDEIVKEVSKRGSTPLVVVKNYKVLGVIELKDVVKGGIQERFERLRTMGIKTVMITGDNALTAVAIAAEAGVDDFIAEATPEDKLNYIREVQKNGHLVAMIGDGTNDAPALAQADVGVAMNTGTQAAREAGNMVDLDSNPTKLLEIVEVGKQLLITRGALTTFSIANDIAKYFAILPALYVSIYSVGGNSIFEPLNIMDLHSPQTAILSAVIFNAFIIIALIPLAIKGVSFVPKSASAILKRNILIYGIGGIVLPFLGIKVIDVMLQFLF